MGWKGELAEQGVKIVNSLVKAFVETDAILLEINPLVRNHDKENYLHLDAKLVIDDNALFRQPEIKGFI